MKLFTTKNSWRWRFSGHESTRGSRERDSSKLSQPDVCCASAAEIESQDFTGRTFEVLPPTRVNFNQLGSTYTHTQTHAWHMHDTHRHMHDTCMTHLHQSLSVDRCTHLDTFTSYSATHPLPVGVRLNTLAVRIVKLICYLAIWSRFGKFSWPGNIEHAGVKIRP